MIRSFVSAALLEALVCPVCHHKLVPAGGEAAPNSAPMNASPAWLHCRGCGRYYPIEDGLAVMLKERAVFEPVKGGA